MNNDSNESETRYMIAWKPMEDGQPAVKIGPHPDYTGWTRAYACTAGHDFAGYNRMDHSERGVALLGLALEMVSTYGVPVADVLNAFGTLPEWRDMAVLRMSGRYASTEEVFRVDEGS